MFGYVRNTPDICFIKQHKANEMITINHIDYSKHGSISQIPGNRPNRDYVGQGGYAFRSGFQLSDCPYYDTSTLSKLWKKGWRMEQKYFKLKTSK